MSSIDMPMSSASSLRTFSSSDHSAADALSLCPVEQPPQLTLDIYATEGLSSAPSTDSGYGSSPSLRSSLEPVVWALYEQWKAADAAALRLPTEITALETCQLLMRTAKETSEAARHGMKPKRRLSTMSLPGLRKRSMHAIVSPVTSEGFIEADDPDIAKLEKRLQELQTSVLQTRSTAAPLDDLFDNLLRFLDGECPVSPEPLRSPSVLSTYSSSSHDSYRRARKTVSARDDAYLVTRTTAEALRRACRIVQAAHRLYREAKEDIETVCGPERGRLAIIFSDEESRNKTYLEAATRAQEAQGCFDECVSVLKPHWDLLTRPEVEAYDNLRNTGLLQAATLYRLMYGGANFDMGIKQSVQFMLQRQNDVYVQLTNFAAGVQNCTAHCDTVEREACESRNAARRQLIGVYVGADGNSMPMNHGSLETLA